MAIDFSLSELVALPVETFFFGTLPPLRLWSMMRSHTSSLHPLTPYRHYHFHRIPVR